LARAMKFSHVTLALFIIALITRIGDCVPPSPWN
jgi:hypothetical protein